MPMPMFAPGREISLGAAAAARDDAATPNGAMLEVVPKKKRKQYSASEKLRIVRAADAALASGKRGALEALLRKEGIYSSHLAAWRHQLGSRGTLAAQKPGRKPALDTKDRELLAMKKKLAKLERKLYVANAVIALQKKAHEILGIALPELPEQDEES